MEVRNDSQQSEDLSSPPVLRMSIAEKEKLQRMEANRMRKRQQEEKVQRELEAERERHKRQAEEKRQQQLSSSQGEENEGADVEIVSEGTEDFYEKEQRRLQEQVDRMRQGLPVNQSSNDLLKGLDAEIAERMNTKWDTGSEKKACEWIASVTNDDMYDLYECLKSGKTLCKLINGLKPGTIPKYNHRPIHLMERENIQLYLNACDQLGLSRGDLFNISDLHEKRNLQAVIQNIFALGRLAQSLDSFQGPYLQLPSKRSRNLTLVHTSSAPSLRHQQPPKPQHSQTSHSASSSPQQSSKQEHNHSNKEDNYNEPKVPYQSSAPEYQNNNNNNNNTSMNRSTSGVFKAPIPVNRAPRSEDLATINKLKEEVEELKKQLQLAQVFQESKIQEQRIEEEERKQQEQQKEEEIEDIQQLLDSPTDELLHSINDSMPIITVMVIVGKKLHMISDMIYDELQLFRKHHIHDVSLLKNVINNDHLWKELPLSIGQKCVLENMFVNKRIVDDQKDGMSAWMLYGSWLLLPFTIASVLGYIYTKYK